MNLKIIISGGGSGGHIFPAIAIANEIKKIKPEAAILFVGALGKIEMEKVPKAGYPIKGLWISGFHRKEIIRNFSFVFKLLHSLWNANKIVKAFRPDVVIGVGGFASFPTLAVAGRKGIPTLIQEQNSYAGVANKMLKNKVDKVCVAYDQMEKYFPAEKIIKTGNPVRQDLYDLSGKKEMALKHFGLDLDKPTVFLFGGSLGAQSLNESMAANFKHFADHPEIQVLWQAGKLYIERFQNCESAQLPNVHVHAFIDRMDLAYALADVVICRAGALTIAELCLVGKPAILIPSPNVAEDHQTENAKALEGKDAAILISDKNAKEKMISTAFDLLNDEARCKKLSQNIKSMAKPDAVREIVNVMLQLIKHD